jgi:hypothetical protein
MAFRPLVEAGGRAIRSYAHKALGAGPVSTTIANAGKTIVCSNGTAKTKRFSSLTKLFS